MKPTRVEADPARRFALVAVALLLVAGWPAASLAQVPPLTANVAQTRDLSRGSTQSPTGFFEERHSYPGRVGEQVTFRVRTAGFSPQLRVSYRPSSHHVPVVLCGEAQDPGDGGGARISAVLPLNVDYILTVSSSVPGAVGPYTVVVERHGFARVAPGGRSVPRCPTPAVSAGADSIPASARRIALRRGPPEQGQLDSTDTRAGHETHIDVYTYRGRKGEDVAFTVNSSAFDPSLRVVRDPGNGAPLQEVGRDEGKGAGYRARVSVALPADGEYTIVVSSVLPGVSGAYSIQATRRY